MRPVELLALTLLAVSIAAACLSGDGVRWRVAAAAAAVLALGCLWLDRWRWSLWPMGAAALLLIAGSIRGAWRQRAGRRVATAAVAAVLLTASILCCIALPGLPLPTPRGPFGIGVTSIHVVTRPVSGAALVIEQPRTAPAVDVWYPGELPGRTDAAWLSWFLGITETEDARHGVPELRIASGPRKFPVLLYFPGWEGTQIQDFVLIRELVSRGFVVAGVHYPAIDPAITPQARRQSIAWLERPMDFSSPSAAAAAIRRADKRVRLRATDAVSTLDALSRLNDADPAARFTGRLDLERVGIFGFSLGGAVAVESCRLDSRFKAAFNMDGWLFADAAVTGIDQPYMLVTSSISKPSAAELNSRDPWVRLPARYTELDEARADINYRRHGGYLLLLPHAQHLNFTDYVLRSPFRRLNQSGPVDRWRTLQIVADYARAFFRKTLNAGDAPLFTPSDSPYAGASVRLLSWPAPRNQPR